MRFRAIEALAGRLPRSADKLGRFWRPGHRVTGDRQQNSDGAGWEFVHVAIDDGSRIAFSSLHPDERGCSACQALLQALRYYRSLGIHFTRIMTDSGSCYRSRTFSAPGQALGAAASAHQALHAADQRLGRALYPDQSARVGLCP